MPFFTMNSRLNFDRRGRADASASGTAAFTSSTSSSDTESFPPSLCFEISLGLFTPREDVAFPDAALLSHFYGHGRGRVGHRLLLRLHQAFAQFGGKHSNHRL